VPVGYEYLVSYVTAGAIAASKFFSSIAMLALVFWGNNDVTVLHGKVTWLFVMLPQSELRIHAQQLEVFGSRSSET
jgi:hypothetical protein